MFENVTRGGQAGYIIRRFGAPTDQRPEIELLRDVVADLRRRVSAYELIYGVQRSPLHAAPWARPVSPLAC